MVATTFLLAVMMSLPATARPEPVCEDHSLFVKDIAIVRDHGNSKQHVVDALKEYFKDHQEIPESETIEMLKNVDVIYDHPDASPEELQKAYYNFCIKELEV